jgi:hypothetical protein
LKPNPFFSPIEQVKQPSPSVNPANHASFKEGKISLLLITTGSNIILPLVTHLLNPSTKISNLSCLFGKTRLPLNKLIIMSISFLFCVTYLLVIADWGRTFPNPRISCINSRTCLSVVACVITNAKSPLLFTIKEPSPSVKPTNQVKKFSEGILLLGK